VWLSFGSVVVVWKCCYRTKEACLKRDDSSGQFRSVLTIVVEVKGEGRRIGVGCEVGRERGPRALNGLLSWR
jgi:hypothetical protein